MMTVDGLKLVFEKEQSQLGKVIHEYPWKSKASYVQWLADSYCYAFNSTRILALAAGTMPKDLTSLSNRFISHAAEEKGHEKLLESDARYLGYDLKSHQPSHEARVFYHSLYYWLSAAGNPVGLLGWVLALEGVAVLHGKWIYEQCLEAHGDRATRFLKVHSEEDPDHLEKAFKAISSLDGVHLDLVSQSLKQYSRQYCALLLKESSPMVFEKAS